MSKSLGIEMLPADFGDALWIEYGDPDKPRRILIDGGPTNAYDDGLLPKVASLPPDQRHFELLVITHIDADHIDGIVRLLQEDSLGLSFGDIWFNGWQQLEKLESAPSDVLGPEQGEYLGALLAHDQLPWNLAFGKGPVMVPADGALPKVTLAGDLSLTLLTPGLEDLQRLRRTWRKVVEEAGFTPGDAAGALARLRERKDYRPLADLLGAPDDPFQPEDLAAVDFGSDTSAANGSSIALLLEYAGKSVLLSGDAQPKALIDSLERLLAARNETRLKLDALKLSHHGSKKNISPELMDKLRCRNFLVSSSGARFRHPDSEVIDLLIQKTERNPHFYFNYASGSSAPWASRELQKARGFRATFPAGLGVDVLGKR